MKKFSLIILMFTVMFCSISNADTIYRTNGEQYNRNNSVTMWPVQFKNKSEAIKVALKLENGEVFKDYSTNLYQVWYGNVEITGVVVTSNITEQ